MAIVTAENLTKHYGAGTNLTKALDGVSLTIAEGEFAAIAGASGSGKSTLLRGIDLLEHPTSGHIFVDGADGSTQRSTSSRSVKRSGCPFSTLISSPT